MTYEQLERRVRFLTRYAAGLTLALVVTVAVAAGPAATTWVERLTAGVVEADTVRAGVVIAERLNVVEPDGSLALLAANSERMPGLIIDGDTLTSRGGAAGLIFFYEGEEVGGLIYRLGDDPGDALGHLSLDQYHHDQVAVMQYEGAGARQRAGFYVNDRSTAFDAHDLKALYDSAATLPAAERGAVMAGFRARAGAGEYGGRRVALESRERVAALRLSDYRGRERLRLAVDSVGTARIEFLDAEGDVVRTIAAQD